MNGWMEPGMCHATRLEVRGRPAGFSVLLLSHGRLGSDSDCHTRQYLYLLSYPCSPFLPFSVLTICRLPSCFPWHWCHLVNLPTVLGALLFDRIWEVYLVLSQMKGTSGLSGSGKLHVFRYPHEPLSCPCF